MVRELKTTQKVMAKRVPDYWVKWFANPDRPRSGIKVTKEDGWTEYADGCYVDRDGSPRGGGWSMTPRADCEEKTTSRILAKVGIKVSKDYDRSARYGKDRDQDYLEDFPLHTSSKQSLRIQRLRLREIATSVGGDWASNFLANNIGMDHNIAKYALLWFYFLSPLRRDFVMRWDIWKQPLVTVRQVFTDLSNEVKSGCWRPSRPMWLVELANLVGYQFAATQEYEERVLLDKAKEVVEGAAHLPRVAEEWWPESYHAVAADRITVPDNWQGGDPVTLDDYIRRGEWVTGGAGDRGKVTVTVVKKDGTSEQAKIKPTKNLIRSSLDYDVVMAGVRSHPPTHDVALVKNERLKIRLIVMCRLEQYLVTSWLNHLVGPIYREWKGGVLQESVAKSAARYKHMIISVASGKFGDSYDFEKMDCQPLAAELNWYTEVDGRLLRRAEYNALGAVEWRDWINSQIVHRSLLVRGHSGRRDHWVKGDYGIISGNRETSRQGLAKNLTDSEVATRAVMHILTGKWGRDDSIHEFDMGALGDDHYQLNSELYLQLKAIAMFNVGARPSSKNNLYYDGVEFLRKFVTGHRSGQKVHGEVRGYLTRAVTAIASRNPNSNDPSDDALVLKSIAGAVRLCNIRSHTNWQPESPFLEEYCRSRDLPPALLEIPQWLGGFGVTLPTRRWVQTYGYKTKASFSIETDADSSWERDDFRDRLATIGIEADDQGLRQWQERRVEAVIGATAIPAVSGRVRRAKRADYKEARYLHSPLPRVVLLGIGALPPDYVNYDLPVPATRNLKHWRRWIVKKGDYGIASEWAKVKGWKLRETLALVGLDHGELVQVATSLGLRPLDALDHLMGEKYWPSKWDGFGDLSALAGEFEGRWFPATVESAVLRGGKESRWAVCALYIEFWRLVEDTDWWRSAVATLRA